MSEPVWLQKEALLLLHQRALALFGGGEGIRDEGLLDSALTRPVNVFHHRPEADLAASAAAYSFGLVHNHPFVEGNKRAAFAAAGVFLESNGLQLTADPLETIAAVMGLAAGHMEEGQFASWLRANTRAF